MFLRSVGIAGVVVVFVSVLAAITLLPAVLLLIGGRIERGRIFRMPGDHVADHGFWSALSHWVMARPVWVFVPTLALLIAVGLPFRHVNISSPDATILPRSTESRQGYDLLVDAFGPGEISPLIVTFASPSSVFSNQNVIAIHQIVSALESDPRVARVDGFTAYGVGVSDEQAIGLANVQRGAATAGLGARFQQFASDPAAMILVYLRSYPNSAESKDILAGIRDRKPGGDLTMAVDGGTAEIVDVVDEMYGSFPVAIGSVLIATYVILFLLFNSIILPIKAILMNVLSLIASYGALVWIFQEGHFSTVLRFDAQGYIEASLPIIMFCVLFGLSMDYEVFLLTRVREEWERTGDNVVSVATGLQRSGRIITSAALIVVVVTSSFVSADVILVKALGFGIALAVLLDATVVRALLVPATMRLLGNANWWVPRWLGRRVPGVRENVDNRSHFDHLQ
jgi:RND superfamily putative drug exporter